MSEKRLRQMVLDVAKSIARKILDTPYPVFEPGSVCKVKHSVVVDKSGTLLRGAMVEVTGVQDRSGRYQIRIVSLPDHVWEETSRLPYGPGFVLFVGANVLEAVA